MSIELYKLLHLLGVVLLFFALGGFALRAFSGGSASEDGRKIAAITHGVGLVLLLVSGFGLLARYGLGFPTWAMVKVGIWLLLGGAIALLRRMPWYAAIWWVVVPLLGLTAAYLGIFKPAF
ncbi:MAG TPA: hypothetical protein PK413_00965 [Thermoanaerobaculia bacterium]|nr:hypothetical protein [Thermoanaerobaculia bacterium]